MIIPGANDPQFTDFTANTNGNEQLAFAVVLIPPNFLGEVEVDICGQVTDIASNEIGEWKAKLRQQVSRHGSAAWSVLTGLSTVPGHSWASPIALEFGSSFGSSVGDDPSVWKLKIQGVDGKTSAFNARVAVTGTVFDG